MKVRNVLRKEATTDTRQNFQNCQVIKFILCIIKHTMYSNKQLFSVSFCLIAARASRTTLRGKRERRCEREIIKTKTHSGCCSLGVVLLTHAISYTRYTIARWRFIISIREFNLRTLTFTLPEIHSRGL